MRDNREAKEMAALFLPLIKDPTATSTEGFNLLCEMRVAFARAVRAAERYYTTGSRAACAAARKELMAVTKLNHKWRKIVIPETRTAASERTIQRLREQRAKAKKEG